MNRKSLLDKIDHEGHGHRHRQVACSTRSAFGANSRQIDALHQLIAENDSRDTLVCMKLEFQQSTSINAV